ncbi:unnamed protein product [Effrenium voratum]|nr:unnamed protein product [Effrenium voratum]
MPEVIGQGSRKGKVRKGNGKGKHYKDVKGKGGKGGRGGKGGGKGGKGGSGRDARRVRRPRGGRRRRRDARRPGPQDVEDGLAEGEVGFEEDVDIQVKGDVEGDFEGNPEGDFEGDLEGDFEGNPAGDLEGDFEGDFEADVEGDVGDFEGDLEGDGLDFEAEGDVEVKVEGDLEGEVDAGGEFVELQPGDAELDPSLGGLDDGQEEADELLEAEAPEASGSRVGHARARPRSRRGRPRARRRRKVDMTADQMQRALLRCGESRNPEVYTGIIKNTSRVKGVGFISCQATWQLFGRDVVVFPEQLKNCAVGEVVRFRAQLEEGQPLGYDLQPVSSQEAAGSGAPPDTPKEGQDLTQMLADLGKRWQKVLEERTVEEPRPASAQGPQGGQCRQS